MRTRTTALVMTALLAPACSGTAPDDEAAWEPSEQVSTPRGEIRGWTDDDVIRFQGVPYAEPPTGERRFAAPQPVAAWDEELDATTQGPPCPQPDPTGVMSGQEDCLHVDITVPSSPSETPRPVMVWVHGGGFTEGSGTDFDPRQLAVEGDVVVVTLNYRLGALGFLATPGMPEGGSFGLLDQQEALRFVQDVAPSVGGDADAVTLFGESAGATSLCFHLLAPESVELFDRAIVQSATECGAPAPLNAYTLPDPEAPPTDAPWMPPPQLEEVKALGTQVAAELGCGDEDPATCLRGLPVEDLMAAHAQFARPAVGTQIAPTAPWERLEEVSVPVLTGFTRDESRIYAMLGAVLGTPFGPGTYEPAIRASFGDRADAVLETYPLTDFPGDAEAWGAVYTDRTFACPQVHANDEMSGSTEVFAYEFADRSAPPPIPPLPGTPEPGAAHSAELPYLFEVDGQPVDEDGNTIPLTEQQQELASRMIAVWTAFAHDDDVPVDPWDDSGEALTFSEDGVTATDPAQTHNCAFWDLDDLVG